MTIRDFVISQPKQGINEWLKVIEENNFKTHEKIILDCAEHFNKIEINHNANFIDTLKIKNHDKRNI